MKRSSRIERFGEYLKMPSWLSENASRKSCEACHRKYGTIDMERFVQVKQICDHIFPVRFLLRLRLNPHLSINVVSICAGCHGRKLRYETLIFAGDVLGFMAGLRRIGYPMQRVREAAAHYGFTEAMHLTENSQRI